MTPEIDIEGLQGFLDESHDSMQGIENDFIELEKDPDNKEIINRIFRPKYLFSNLFQLFIFKIQLLE